MEKQIGSRLGVDKVIIGVSKEKVVKKAYSSEGVQLVIDGKVHQT